MMTVEARINAFAALGQKIERLKGNERELLYERAHSENPWFTGPNLEIAFKGVGRFLIREKLAALISKYKFNEQPKRVGVVMAGNIPLVGFHDFLSVLISGNTLVMKPSSQDSVLINFVKDELIKIEPGFSNNIFIEERLNSVDAIIATGSDNTARYFEYYFRNKPHVIRKNRSSCAILLGEEPDEELKNLGRDVFTYFGLGCRNVSKLFVPMDYDFSPLFKSWEGFSSIIHHHKYVNNYDYRKSIFLINKNDHFDTGFLLVIENEDLVSPISVLYFEYYLDQEDLSGKIYKQEDKIQCIVSAKGWFKGSIPFGQSQFPDIDDFADGVDTLAFLTSL
jgi:hypothetical protein